MQRAARTRWRHSPKAGGEKDLTDVRFWRAKRTWREDGVMSASDPERTLARGFAIYAAPEMENRSNARHPSTSFRPMMPARISARKVSRRTDALSPNAAMPAIATPKTPTPTHTAYAVPTGNPFTANETITNPRPPPPSPIRLAQKPL